MDWILVVGAPEWCDRKMLRRNAVTDYKGKKRLNWAA
jgi:hypothetical protein